VRVFQRGEAKDAFNWVGPADHEPLFFALLGLLRRTPEVRARARARVRVRAKVRVRVRVRVTLPLTLPLSRAPRW